MKLKSIIKKGFTLMELAIVIGVIAVLTATSVGLYFGLSEKEPEKEAVSIQDKVIALWNSHINNGLNYATGLDGKANEFCTGYVKEKGVDVDLNYRVLEFENSVSTILPESGNAKNIQRAYDPSNDNKYAVVIKVESAYPTYFISSTTSVLETSVPFETEDLLLSDLYDNVFIQESGILEKYNITSPFDRFNEIFELDNIVVDGKIVRGIKYIRYNVTNESGNYYSTLYCRENRTLNDDCEGEYHPKYSEIATGNGTLIFNDQFRMVEKRSDEQFYNYDPDRVYSTEKNTHMSELETYDVLDKDGNVIETKKAPISSKKYQYIIDEKDISYVSFLQGGSSDPSLDGSVGEDGSIDLTNPVNPEIFDNPGNNGGSTGGVEADDNKVNVEEFPITLFFTHEVDYTTGSGSFLTDLYNLIRKLFGITQTKFQYLFFNSFKTLNEFINLAGFKDLLKTPDQMSYIYINGDLVLDLEMNIPKNFAFVIDHRTSETNATRKEYIAEFVDRHGNNPGVSQLDDFNMGGNSQPKHQVTWYQYGQNEKRNRLTLKGDGALNIVNGNSYLFVEADLNPSTSDYGYEVREYGTLTLTGTTAVNLDNTCGARILGLADGTGRIVARFGATVSEPFKVTDYQLWTKSVFTNKDSTYVGNNVFPSDFYFLDSIRAQLIVQYGAKYIGLVAFYRIVDLAVKYQYTCIDAINLVAADSQNGEKLFSMNSGSVLYKDCDDKGRSTFNFQSGSVDYQYETFDVKSVDDLFGSSNNGATIHGWNQFSTTSTGFKLSNIDLVVSNGGTLNVGKTAGGTRLEVLPSSSVQILEKGRLNISNNSSLVIDNFYQYDASNGSQAFCDLILSNGSSYTNERQVALFNIYHASTKPMFVNRGTINAVTTDTVGNPYYTNNTEYRYETCNFWCEDHGAKKNYHYCDKTIECVTKQERYYSYNAACIFSWTADKMEGNFGQRPNTRVWKTTTEAGTASGTHEKWTVLNKCKHTKTINISYTAIHYKHNAFLFNFAGTGDSLVGYATYEIF